MNLNQDIINHLWDMINLFSTNNGEGKIIFLMRTKNNYEKFIK